MHYILKLPGTVARVVDYPTTSEGFVTDAEASLKAVTINNRNVNNYRHDYTNVFVEARPKVA